MHALGDSRHLDTCQVLPLRVASYTFALTSLLLMYWSPVPMFTKSLPDLSYSCLRRARNPWFGIGSDRHVGSKDSGLEVELPGWNR